MKEKLPIHPAADLLPQMTDEEFAGLKASIKAHGQIHPCQVWQGMIIDGRSRYRACLELGIEPKLEVIPADQIADPLGYAVTVNMDRRHLSASQLAMLAAKVQEQRDRLAKAQPTPEGKQGGNVSTAPKGKARDAAGAAVGVSGRMVGHAKKVLRHGTPELKAAVDRGELPVHKAAKIADMKPTEQAKAIEKAKAGEDVPEVKPPSVEPANGAKITQEQIDALAEPHKAFVNAIDQFRRHVRAYRQTAEAQAADPATGIHLKKVVARITKDAHDLLQPYQPLYNLREAVPLYVPHGICEKCRGVGCNTCEQSGFWVKGFADSRKKRQA